MLLRAVALVVPPRWVVVSVLLVASLATAPDGLAQRSVADVAERAGPAVVALETLGAGGQVTRTGSGFLVENGRLVVTNYHVVSGATGVRATLRNGARLSVLGVAAFDVDHDLTVLAVGTGGTRTLDLTLWRNLREGAEVVAIGNPRGYNFTISEGIISALRTEPGGHRRIQFTAPISPGSSGGPLLDLNGRVIGITTAYRPDGQSLNFAIPSDYVEEALRRRPRVPLSFTAFAAAVAEHEREADRRWAAANLREYREPIFHLTYLTGWNVQASASWAGTVYHRTVLFSPPTAHRAEVDGYVSEGIRIGFQIPQTGYQWTQTLDAWAGSRVEALLDANPGFVVTEARAGTVAGHPARVYEMVGQNDNITEPEKTVFYFLGNQRWFLTVEVVTPTSRLASNLPLFDALLGTLRIAEPRPPGNGLPPR